MSVLDGRDNDHAGDVGFVHGALSIIWAAPRVGARLAQLMATLVMLAVTLVAARSTALLLRLLCLLFARLGMGLTRDRGAQLTH